MADPAPTFEDTLAGLLAGAERCERMRRSRKALDARLLPEAVELQKQAQTRTEETLSLARSVIRDLARGWPIKELAATPEELCAKLSILLGQDFNFETGDATPWAE